MVYDESVYLWVDVFFGCNGVFVDNFILCLYCVYIWNFEVCLWIDWFKIYSVFGEVDWFF